MEPWPLQRLQARSLEVSRIKGVKKALEFLKDHVLEEALDTKSIDKSSDEVLDTLLEADRISPKLKPKKPRTTKEEPAEMSFEDALNSAMVPQEPAPKKSFDDALESAMVPQEPKKPTQAPEIFTFGPHSFNIDKAVSLMNDIPPTKITPTKAWISPFIHVDKKYADKLTDKDLAKPVIFGILKDNQGNVLGHKLIDGHHRAWKALQSDPPKELNAHFLSEEDTAKILE